MSLGFFAQGALLDHWRAPAQKSQRQVSQKLCWPARRVAHCGGARLAHRALLPRSAALCRAATRTLRADGRQACCTCWCARGALAHWQARAGTPGERSGRFSRARAARPAARELRHLSLGFFAQGALLAWPQQSAQNSQRQVSQKLCCPARRVALLSYSRSSSRAPLQRPAIPRRAAPPHAARCLQAAFLHLLRCEQGAGAQAGASWGRQCARWPPVAHTRCAASSARSATLVFGLFCAGAAAGLAAPPCARISKTSVAGPSLHPQARALARAAALRGPPRSPAPPPPPAPRAAPVLRLLALRAACGLLRGAWQCARGALARRARRAAAQCAPAALHPLNPPTRATRAPAPPLPTPASLSLLSAWWRGLGGGVSSCALAGGAGGAERAAHGQRAGRECAGTPLHCAPAPTPTQTPPPASACKHPWGAARGVARGAQQPALRPLPAAPGPTLHCPLPSLL